MVVETDLWHRWREVHSRQLSALDALCAVVDDQHGIPEEWDRAAAAFDAVFQHHRRLEEQIFFPSLARYFAGGGPIPVMLGEHARMNEEWQAIRHSREEASSQVKELLGDFANQVRLHVRKEDLTLLPLARAKLSSRDWQKLEQEAGHLGEDSCDL